MSTNEWVHLQQMPAHPFTCGFCGKGVGADKGYQRTHPAGTPQDIIAICPIVLTRRIRGSS